MDPTRNRRGWAERSGAFSPTYYADLGTNNVSKSLVTVLEHYLEDDISVLEVGCSSGRHLAHLLEHDYTDLTGIDVNDESFEVMADYFPALAQQGTFHTGSIERVVPDLPENAFDVVYAVETLQHVHPDESWVFKELARVTNDLLVTVENEGPDPEDRETEVDVHYVDDEFPLYRRNWNRVFSELGLTQVLCKPSKPDTIRVFRPTDRT